MNINIILSFQMHQLETLKPVQGDKCVKHKDLSTFDINKLFPFLFLLKNPHSVKPYTPRMSSVKLTQVASRIFTYVKIRMFTELE